MEEAATLTGAWIVEGCVGTTSDTIDRIGRDAEGIELPAVTEGGTVDETAGVPAVAVAVAVAAAAPAAAAAAAAVVTAAGGMEWVTAGRDEVGGAAAGTLLVAPR